MEARCGMARFQTLWTGGLSMVIAAFPAGATAGSLLGCDCLPIHDRGAPGLSEGQRDALDQARLFFDRVAPAEIDAALGTAPPGTLVEVTARFIGDDARWRFLRPIDLPSDPDGLVLAPPQRQFLIRPLPDSPARVLLLAGLDPPGAAPGGDVLAWPMLAGLDRAGSVFLLDPLRPGDCLWPLAGIGPAVGTFLRQAR